MPARKKANRVKMLETDEIKDVIRITIDRCLKLYENVHDLHDDDPNRVISIWIDDGELHGKLAEGEYIAALKYGFLHRDEIDSLEEELVSISVCLIMIETNIIDGVSYLCLRMDYDPQIGVKMK